MAQLTRGELKKIDQRPLDPLKRSVSEQSLEESMDPPSFTRNILKDELRISEHELNKYQKILALKAQKITLQLSKGEDDEGDHAIKNSPADNGEPEENKTGSGLLVSNQREQHQHYEAEQDEENLEERRYNKFVESLVPVATKFDLLPLSATAYNAGELGTVPEPDDSEIDKMILNEGERALKTRLWTTLNKEWIAQNREKRRVKKADSKKKKLLSAQASSLRSQQSITSQGPSSPTSSHHEKSING